MRFGVGGQGIFVGHGRRSHIAVAVGRGGNARDHERAIGACYRDRIGDAGAEDRRVGDRERFEPVRAGEIEGAALRKCRGVGRTAIGQIVLVHHLFRAVHIEAGQNDGVVRAVDGDGNRGRGEIAVAVGQGVAEDIRKAFGRVQCLDRGQGVVEHVFVFAIGGDRERPVGAADRHADIVGDVARRLARRDAGNLRAVGALGIGSAVVCIRITADNVGARDDIAGSGKRPVL